MKLELGPLAQLLGKWEAVGTGWNMIALPFKGSTNPNIPYRIPMNQYNERLEFSAVADNIPNRGKDVDQEVASLDYQQAIEQIAVDDSRKSGVAGVKGDSIHHEPGLWIHVKNGEEKINEINIARLASIPHGNSVLAVGSSKYLYEMPVIPPINALPFGRFEKIDQTPPDEYDFRSEDEYL